MDIDPSKVTKRIVARLKSILDDENCKDLLIAISGGVDSAVSATLASKVLESKNIHPVLLPYGKLNKKGEEDAWLVIKALRIPKDNVITIDIKPYVDKIFSYDLKMDEGRKGNIMARMRMQILYDLSKKLNYLVLGTENKTEHLLGYYTRFGDEASDIEPIRELYKTQVFAIAKYLQLPDKIISNSPTAGLWEGQTDEGEFGFSYEIADKILYLYYEKKLSKDKIISKGYDKKIVDRVWWWIEKGEFKDRMPRKISL